MHPTKRKKEVDVTKEYIGDKFNIRETSWSPKQLEIIKQAFRPETKLTLIDGIWGSGKTIMAVYVCLKLLERHKIDKIVYIRNAVQSGSGSLGWLGGDLPTRLGPYMAPFYDKLEEMLDKPTLEYLTKNDLIEGKPACLLRGTTFRNCGIIFDELSSFEHEDIMLSLSRIGEGCHVWAIGDSYQADVKFSGFRGFFDTFNDDESRENGVFAYELRDEADIKRSSLLRFILKKVKAGQIEG